MKNLHCKFFGKFKRRMSKLPCHTFQILKLCGLKIIVCCQKKNNVAFSEVVRTKWYRVLIPPKSVKLCLICSDLFSEDFMSIDEYSMMSHCQGNAKT